MSLRKFAHLIDDRHGYANLVVMCGTHSTVIDSPLGRHSVADVVAIKRVHEDAMRADRSEEKQRQDTVDLREAAIVDGWADRIQLDDWVYWMGPVFGDGHPRMERENFDRLTEARQWMFSRVWSGQRPELEQAFDNFRYVAQDLQLVVQRYPSDRAENRGWVEPVRFYNSYDWAARFTHPQLDRMYERWAYLLEDLAL